MYFEGETLQQLSPPQEHLVLLMYTHMHVVNPCSTFSKMLAVWNFSSSFSLMSLGPKLMVSSPSVYWITVQQ